MKLILLFLNFLIFSSALLDNVRKEFIDTALLYLPKRENANFLKMCSEMLKRTITYSMNKVESAYFVYKWISKNIEYSCDYLITEENPNEVLLTYNEGKGGAIGIAGLFKTMCEFLNIESNVISGLTKINTYNKTHLIDIKDYAWNSILINRNHYLIDVIRGTGYCSRTNFYKSQSDKYFGINPRESIRFRFPKDKSWQFLSNPVTKEEFSSFALITGDLFKFFKTYSPDIQALRNEKKINVELTFDDPIDKIEIFAMFDTLKKMNCLWSIFLMIQ